MTSRPLETHMLLSTFPSVREAERGLAALLRVGVLPEQISVATPEGRTIRYEHIDELEEPGKPAAESATMGGAIGAAVGGVAATSAVSLMGPIGGLFLLGPLFGGLLTGATAGGLLGAMVGRGVSPDLADRYEQSVRQGRTLVAVEPRSLAEQAVVHATVQSTGGSVFDDGTQPESPGA